MKTIKDKTREEQEVLLENEFYRAEQPNDILAPPLMQNRGEGLLNRHTSPSLG